MDKETVERVKREWQREASRFENKERPADFPVLPPLPVSRYTDQAFYDLEQKHFWPKVWQIAGHADELPEPGNYKLWREAGVPIILVRGHDNEIRAFYNTCQHRGGPLVSDEFGKCRMFVCQYHCWSYDLEGCLKQIPDEHEFGDIDKSGRSLSQVRCEMWGNLIFVNRDPDADPLLEFLGPMVREFEDYDLENAKLFHTLTLDIPCNWKVAIDGFQEVYHVKHIHPQTIAHMLDYRSAVFTLYKNGHSRLILPKGRGAAADAAQVLAHVPPGDDPALEIDREGNRSYTVFPNIITPGAEHHFPMQVFVPTGVDSCQMHLYYLARPEHADPESEACQTVVAMFNHVMQEDMNIFSRAQESLSSGALKHFTLSYVERRIYLHQEEIDDVIGRDNLPERYWVEPLLGRFIEDW